MSANAKANLKAVSWSEWVLYQLTHKQWPFCFKLNDCICSSHTLDVPYRLKHEVDMDSSVKERLFSKAWAGELIWLLVQMLASLCWCPWRCMCYLFERRLGVAGCWDGHCSPCRDLTLCFLWVDWDRCGLSLSLGLSLVLLWPLSLSL